MYFRKMLILVVALSLILMLTGCDSLFTSSGSGELALFMADAPVNEIKEVNVTIDRVEVHSEENGWITVNEFEGGKKFDLLTLRFDEELLGQKALPAGTYTEIRLIVAASKDKEGVGPEIGESYVVYQDDSKENENIFIPSGIQTGLKIHHRFIIEDGTITQLILDTDVREILNEMPEQASVPGYVLRSTAIKIIDKVISGSVEGIVTADDETLITDNDVIVEAVGTDVSTVATSEETTEKPLGSFKLRGLEEGTYEIVAYIEESDTKTYTTEPVEVKVTAGETNLELVDNPIELTAN